MNIKPLHLPLHAFLKISATFWTIFKVEQPLAMNADKVLKDYAGPIWSLHYLHSLPFSFKMSNCLPTENTSGKKKKALFPTDQLKKFKIKFKHSISKWGTDRESANSLLQQSCVCDLKAVFMMGGRTLHPYIKSHRYKSGQSPCSLNSCSVPKAPERHLNHIPARNFKSHEKI